jgi:hypothetical protein
MDLSRMRANLHRPRKIDGAMQARREDEVAPPANDPGPSKGNRKIKIVIVLFAAAITILWVAFLLALMVRSFF